MSVEISPSGAPIIWDDDDSSPGPTEPTVDGEENGGIPDDCVEPWPYGETDGTPNLPPPTPLPVDPNAPPIDPPAPILD
jgi:hypothetical protein